MKKNLLFLSVALLLLVFIQSCGGDNNPVPSIEGTWRMNERTITTNYPDYDRLMNQYFRDDAARYELLRVFTPNSVLATATLPNSGGVPSRIDQEGNYKIVKDSLFIEDQILLKTIRYRYLLGDVALVTYRQVDKTDLIAIFGLIGLFDPNILPNDIKGELKTREVRVNF